MRLPILPRARKNKFYFCPCAPAACPIPAAGAAFTLIELLLVVLLLLLLFSAAVVNFAPLQQDAGLEEGAMRIESLIRFARAHAANTGRKVQLAFIEDNSREDLWPVARVQLTWEPDPLGQPGVFLPLPEGVLQAEGINELVHIDSVRLTDEAEEEPAPGNATTSATGVFSFTGATEEDLPEPEPTSPEFFKPITFFPDGSSDSAEIVMISPEPETERRLAVRLEGVTGALRRYWLNSEGDPLIETNVVDETVASEELAP